MLCDEAGGQGDRDPGRHLGDAGGHLDQAEAQRVELGVAPERAPGRRRLATFRFGRPCSRCPIGDLVLSEVGTSPLHHGLSMERRRCHVLRPRHYGTPTKAYGAGNEFTEAMLHQPEIRKMNGFEPYFLTLGGVSVMAPMERPTSDSYQ